MAKSKKRSKKGTKQINGSYKQNNNIGMYFAVGSLSLQTLPREIRHTFANEYYHDIDISNCHPVLISQYAKSKNWNENTFKNILIIEIQDLKKRGRPSQILIEARKTKLIEV